MEELAGERLVDDNHTLRIRPVRIGERPAREHRNLQGIEIARGDIHLVCRNRLSHQEIVAVREEIKIL